MGIKVAHNYAGAAIGGAFGAGRNRAKQRKQKYQLDLLREQQRLAQRREELFLRGGGLRGAARLGARAGAARGVAEEGNWVDPTAGMDPVELKERKKAWERKRRLGKVGGPSPYDPVFVPRDKDAEERALEIKDRDEERKYKEGQAEEELKRKAEAERKKARGAARAAGDAAERAAREDGRYSPEVETQLDKVNRDIINLQKMPMTDLEKKDAMLQELYKKQDELREEIAPVRSWAEKNKASHTPESWELYGKYEREGPDGKPMLPPSFKIKDPEAEAAERAEKKRAYRIELKKLKMGNGDPAYTDEKIEEMVEKEFPTLEDGMAPPEAAGIGAGVAGAAGAAMSAGAGRAGISSGMKTVGEAASPMTAEDLAQPVYGREAVPEEPTLAGDTSRGAVDDGVERDLLARPQTPEQRFEGMRAGVAGNKEAQATITRLEKLSAKNGHKPLNEWSEADRNIFYDQQRVLRQQVMVLGSGRSSGVIAREVKGEF